VNYSRIVLLRQPTHRVLCALRDELPQVGTFMHGIASIRCLEKFTDVDGTLHAVHEWTATASVPRSIESRADAGALAWIERSLWDSRSLESEWTVESRLLGKSVTGTGVTRLTSAMGGRGTRIEFQISANVESSALGPLAGGKLSSGITNAAAGVLAKTMQDLGVAVEAFLEADEKAVALRSSPSDAVEQPRHRDDH
jgi:hypothetical protein